VVKKVVVYSAVLIGTYLLVANATNAGKLLASAGSAASGYAKTLQGR
jgi:hypothetical protein